MGQTLRRAMGRLPNSVRTGPSHEPSIQNISRNPEQVPLQPRESPVTFQDRVGASIPEDLLKLKVENNILEERSQDYDAMLQKMVGTIKTIPGGKLTMGEAIVVQQYNVSRRPMPKVRSSKEWSGGAEKLQQQQPGTLTVAQLHEIMLLHQGASMNAPMDIQAIAEKFRCDASELQVILRFLSLPPQYCHEKNDFSTG